METILLDVVVPGGMTKIQFPMPYHIHDRAEGWPEERMYLYFSGVHDGLLYFDCDRCGTHTFPLFLRLEE